MKRILFFTFFLILVSFKFSFATHGLGGDLSYTAVGPNQYEITLRVYRDCNGINLPSTQTINWSGSCGSGSSTATRINEVDLTPFCPSQQSSCNQGNGTVGVEEHTYTTIVTLPSNCTDVVFNYRLCCRNNAITTIQNSPPIYFTASVLDNQLIPANSSVVFNNEPSSFSCVNQPVVYNQGAFDPDGDSLYYILGDCLEGLNNPVNYSGGYSGPLPLGSGVPITLNPLTGSISFTPNAVEVAVICMTVQEYRNGVLIAEIIRDIQFTVLPCTNSSPSSSGVNGSDPTVASNLTTNVCAGTPLCFDLIYSDPTSPGDVLNANWNNEITGATFTVSGPGVPSGNQITGTFCWTPPIGTPPGTYSFSVNVFDDACPLQGSNTYTYEIVVAPNPNTATIVVDSAICPGDTSLLSLTASPVPESVIWTLSPSLFLSDSATGYVFPDATTTYTAQVFFPDGCRSVANATVIVDTMNVIANANDTILCMGDTLIMFGTSSDNYVWDNGVVDSVPFVPTNGIVTYTVEATNSIGCVSTDSLEITVNPILGIANSSADSVCIGDSIILNGTGAVSYVWNNGVVDSVAFEPPLGITNYIMDGTDINGCNSQDSILITVSPFPIVSANSDTSLCLGDSLTLIGTGASTYIWDNGQTDGVPFTPPVGLNTYIVTGTSDVACSASDTVDVLVNALPAVVANTSGNDLCFGSAITLTGSGALTYAWDNGGIDGVSFVPPLDTTTYTVTATDINGCVNEDSIDINIFPGSVITANASATVVCENDTVILTGSGGVSYVWDNGQTDGVGFVPPVGTTTYTVTGTDANGCVNIDSIDVLVYPLPAVVANASSIELCENDTVTLTGSGAWTYVWDNGQTDGVGFVSPVGTTTYTVTGTDVNGCINLDSIDVLVNPLPNVVANANATVLCENDTVTLSGSGAATYVWDNGVTDNVGFVSPVGTTTYTVTGTDANTCVNVDSIDILVNPLPVIVANASATVVCENDTVILTGSGGVSYVWDNGQTDGVGFVPPVGTTTYTVTGTDANGCVNVDSIDILVNPLPAVVANSSSVELCENDTVTLTGSGAWTYVWDNGQTDGVGFVSPVGTTTYTVTGTDNNGCINQDSIDVLVNPLPLVVANTTDTTVCNGGVLTLTGSGATSYVWNNGGIDGVPFTPPIGQTNYIVVGTDVNGCVNIDSIEVGSSPALTVTANTNTNNICLNDSITLTGSGLLSYTWDNGGVDGVSFTPPLGTTRYTVTGFDSNGCSAVDSIDILVNPLPAVLANASSIELCENDTVTLTGSGAWTYVWDNGQTDGVGFVPPVGTTTYTVTGTDANGCVNQDSIDVLVNPLPNVVANASATVLCENDTVTLSGSGAATYVWDNGVTDNVGFISPVWTTTYTVTGTDANTCVNIDSIDILVNPLPVIVANASATVVCENDTVILTGSGGVNYVWDNGQTDGVGFVPPVGTTTYTVTGTDVNGCVNVDSIDVLVNPLPAVVANASSIELCENDTVTLTGSGAWTYVWDNGQTDGVGFVPPVGTTTYTVTGTDTNGCVNQDSIDVLVNPLPNVVANASATVLCENDTVTLSGSGAAAYVWDNGVTDNVGFISPVWTTTYTVTGTDANTCVNIDSIDILVNPLPVIVANASATVVCENDTVILTGSGGVNYVWDNGQTDGVGFVPPVGTTTYTVTGTDVNGCVNVDSIDVLVNPLPAVVANASSIELCENDTVTLTGSGAWTYVWDNGQTDGVGFVSPVGTTTYTVAGTDTNGCINLDSIDVLVNPLPNVVANASATVLCENDTVTLSGSGAATYVWDNGVTDNVGFVSPVGTTTYTVTGTDANTCVNVDSIDILVNPLPVIVANASETVVCENDTVILTGSGGVSYVWDNGQTDGVGFVPPVGTTTYTVTGTDVNGCVNVDSIDILVYPLPTVVANASSIELCENDTVTLTGSGAWTYVWDNGQTDGVGFVSPVGTTTYTVTGTDANGCVNLDSIDVLVNPLPNVVANASATVLCENDTVTLSGSGAATYVWDNGVTDNVGFVSPVGTTTYTVTGTDANTCVNVDSIDILVNPLPVIVANASATVVCENDTVILTGSGGVSYVWDNGQTDGVGFVPPVGTTTYTVTGTDANGCLNVDSIDILVNPLPTVVANASSIELCENDTVTLTGSGAWTYVWDNGQTDNVGFVSPVGTTTYTVTGTDANGCINLDSIDILVNPLPNVVANANATVLCENDTVTLSGSGSATYIWDNGVTDNVGFVSPVGTTTYTVTGTDANTCVNVDSIDILVNPLPVIVANASATVVCENDIVSLTGSGGVSYVWDNGQTDGVSFVPLVGTTTYTVTGTDANGCVNIDSIDILVNPLPAVIANASDVVLCENEVVVLTGSGASTYSWNNSAVDGSGIVPPVGTTTYVVTGTDLNGCINLDSIDVLVNALPIVVANTSANNICEGESIVLTGSGAQSYTWDNGVADGVSFVPTIGTQVYEVTGTDANTCVNTATISITTLYNANVVAMEDLVVCDVNSISLSSASSFISTYQWGIIQNGVASPLNNDATYNGVNTNQLDVLTNGASNTQFYLELTGECGNIVYDTLDVVVNVSVPQDRLLDTILCEHEVNIIEVTWPGLDFIWNDGSLGQVLSPVNSGTYIVSYEEIGTTCILADTMEITFIDCIDECVVVAPTGFSPNGDGNNDVFRTITSCKDGYTNYEFKIFDRWGTLLFYTSDPNASWDGTYLGQPVPVATYSYVVSYVKAFSEVKELLTGTVTVIR